MKKFIFALLISLISFQPAFSQTLGQDDDTDAAADDILTSDKIPPSLRIVPFQWVDLMDPTKEAKGFKADVTPFLNISSLDEAVDNIELDMSFTYFGEKYTSASIVINGFIALGITSSGGAASADSIRSLFGQASYSPSGIPSPRPPNNIIAPFWVDINFGNSKGYVNYRTFHPEKTNKLFDHIVIQWEDAGLFQDFTWGAADGRVSVTFQVVLFTEGGILFQYKVVDSGNLREAFEQGFISFNDPTIDYKDLTDFDLIKKISAVSIGYEDKAGVEGASWDFAVNSGMSLANELLPEWASGTSGDNFLDIIDGRDRRNNAVTGGSGGGCFIGHKKVALDR